MAKMIGKFNIWGPRGTTEWQKCRDQAACVHANVLWHARRRSSTVETLFITIAKQRNNGSDQRFLWGPFR
jgi:hypothetical protein